MNFRQKICTAFFVIVTSIGFISSVYAGSDFDESNSTEPGNIVIETPENVNNNADNEDFSPNNNDFDMSDNNNNESENNSEHTNEILILPNENPNTQNENLNNSNEDDEDFTENENVSLDTGIVGDINGDRELNAVDLVVLQKYLKGNVFEINENAADINGDGTVSMFDVHALLNLIKAEKKGTGDVNTDGKVDIYDVQSLTAYLANPKNTPINSGNADLNGDSRISTDDLKILKKVIEALRQ